MSDSDIDRARALLRAALDDLASTDALRPQDAADLVADLTALVPVVQALTTRTRDRLAAADRIPGLYDDTGADPRATVAAARSHLTAATTAAAQLTAALDHAHNDLARLGHSDLTSDPLTAATDPQQPPHPGWEPHHR